MAEEWPVMLSLPLSSSVHSSSSSPSAILYGIIFPLPTPSIPEHRITHRESCFRADEDMAFLHGEQYWCEA